MLIFPNINMNQPQVFLCPLPLKHPSLLPSHPTSLGCCWALVWVPWVTQHIPIGCLLHVWWCMFPRYSLHTSYPLPPPRPAHVRKSVLYVCVSTAAVQIGSSVLSFWIPYICVSIWYFFFSFWLTSLCMTESRFIWGTPFGVYAGYSLRQIHPDSEKWTWERLCDCLFWAEDPPCLG